MNILELYNQIYSSKNTYDLGAYIDFNDNDSNLTPQTFIDLYESNRHIIKEALISRDKNIFYKAMRISASYGKTLLWYTEDYQNALDVISKVISSIETHPDLIGKDLYGIDFYTDSIYNRGKINAKLYNYKKARKDLYKLSLKCPRYHDNCMDIITDAPSHTLRMVGQVCIFTSVFILVTGLIIYLTIDSPITYEESRELLLVPILFGIVGLVLIEIEKNDIKYLKRLQNKELNNKQVP